MRIRHGAVEQEPRRNRVGAVVEATAVDRHLLPAKTRVERHGHRWAVRKDVSRPRDFGQDLVEVLADRSGLRLTTILASLPRFLRRGQHRSGHWRVGATRFLLPQFGQRRRRITHLVEAQQPIALHGRPIGLVGRRGTAGGQGGEQEQGVGGSSHP